MSAGDSAVKPATAGASVRLDRLAKRYQDVVAVDEVSLEIRGGEFVTLLGPSGSGKTTTLMMIAGFEIPTDGEIYVDGQAVASTPSYQRNLGMVFQNYALFPHMTVAENIGFPLRQRRQDKQIIARRVAEVLDTVKLAGYQPRYPRQLSGGQQQRVALARAIVFNPRVLLMDEPLGALDKQLREGLQLEIRRLHKELGITFIYVTHDQEEALVMSDRIAVMNGGRIEQAGSPSELYDRPVNRFVASFIGESNFLEGLAGDDDGRTLEVTAGGTALRAVTREDARRGERVVLTVRPEKLTFEGGADGVSGAGNALPATVREVAFVGETRRYVVETPAGTPLVVKQQQRFGVRTREPGDEVVVRWHVEDTRVVSVGGD